MLEATLAELCRGAEDIDPALHSFKNAQQLRVGVRDILGKEQIEATTGALSDIAETCLRQIARVEYDKLTAKLGEPTIGEGDDAGPRCASWSIVALGKFGGRELNYYSDLDLIFLYEADGMTAARRAARAATRPRPTSISSASWRSGSSRSPANWARTAGCTRSIPGLRPTGKSGALATSLAEFGRYFSSGQGQLWERQALCKARVVFGSPAAAGWPRRVARGRLCAALAAPRTPKPSGKCGSGWKKRPRPAI